MVTITLNGRERQFEEGVTVLEAARREGIEIPTLCYHESLGPYGVCRLCLVEAEGPRLERTLLPSCDLQVSDGLTVETDTPLVTSTRKTVVELLLAVTPNTGPLLKIAEKLGIGHTRYKAEKRDQCILCGLCVRVCRLKIGVSALDFATNGENDRKVTEFVTLACNACIGCGSCANICPSGAIRVVDRGDERTIFLYGEPVNTLKLARCENCGKPYVTQKFLDFVMSRLDPVLSAKIKQGLCHDCSREYYTVALTGQFPVFEEFPPIV